MTARTKNSSTTHRNARERGAAMLLVMVFLLLALMALSYGFEGTRQLFAFEEQALRIGTAEDGVEKALGIGIARLRSGVPADSNFSCRVRLRDSDGTDVESYDVIYTQLASDRWSVEAVPSTIDIDDCPDVFATSCPVAP
jgi:hypothetical protein